MSKYISLIPFFSGKSTAKHSNSEKSFETLLQTLESLKSFTHKNYVSCCLRSDFELLRRSLKDQDVIFFENIDPRFLPSNSCRFLQKNLDSYDYIFFTEGDHKLFIDFSILPELEHHLNNGFYVSPQRIESITDYQHNCPEINWNGQKFIIVNYECHPQFGIKTSNHRGLHGSFYLVKDAFTGFAGCFLASKTVFDKVNFIDSEWSPIETTSNYDIFKSTNGQQLKPINFEKLNVHHLIDDESLIAQGRKQVSLQ